MKWTHLLIHHTVTGPQETVATIRAMHRKRGFNTIGYHYLLERDQAGRGHLKTGRPDTRSGAHAGAPKDTFDHKPWNSFAIGLSVVGCFHPGFAVSERMTEPLYQDVLGAAVHLCKKYGIPADHVKFHREVKATACPGDYFPMARLRADIRKALEG
jgi:hypothetical protein